MVQVIAFIAWVRAIAWVPVIAYAAHMGPDDNHHHHMVWIRLWDCPCYDKAIKCLLFTRFHPHRDYLRICDAYAFPPQTSKTSASPLDVIGLHHHRIITCRSWILPQSTATSHIYYSVCCRYGGPLVLWLDGQSNVKIIERNRRNRRLGK